MKEAIEDFLLKNNIEYLKETEIKNYTTMKIGGVVPYYIKPDTLKKLKMLKEYLVRNEKRWRVIGAGSNILAKDGRLGFVVISLRKFNKTEINEDGDIYVDAGVKLGHLCNFVKNKSLKGLEFLIGIPGSIGGAIKQNAGAFGKEIKDVITSVRILDSKNEDREINKELVGFKYRGSELRSDIIILGAKFKLDKGDTKEINELMKIYQAERRKKQPIRYRSAGCIFKNPEGRYAGELIERAGLKGLSYGDAMISVKHANFIVNRGNARYKDVMYLVKKIREKIYDLYGIRLEMEVEVWN